MQSYGKNILLKATKGPTTTDSGIYLPNGAGDARHVSEVISVGEDVDKRIKVGTRVIYASGKTFTYDGTDYISCKEEEILVIL